MHLLSEELSTTMHEHLSVDMCVSIRSGCSTDYLITGDKQVEFSFGGLQSGCQFAFDAPALRNFIAVAANALAELEGQVTQQQVNGAATSGSLPVARH